LDIAKPEGEFMKRKQFVPALFFAAAAVALSTSPTWAQSSGQTDSERTDKSDSNPLPEGSPYSGSTDPSKGKGPAAQGQSSKDPVRGGKDTSVGGTKSKRTDGRDSNPLPEGSPYSGSTDASKAGKGPKDSSPRPEGAESIK
jgi:hypothetical protein